MFQNYEITKPNAKMSKIETLFQKMLKFTVTILAANKMTV